MIDLTAAQRRDLMEIVDDRHDRGSIILASQLPVESSHATIGDPTYADAILDRVVHKPSACPSSAEAQTGNERRGQHRWRRKKRRQEIARFLNAKDNLRMKPRSDAGRVHRPAGRCTRQPQTRRLA
jgi:hypothetical protein